MWSCSGIVSVSSPTTVHGITQDTSVRTFNSVRTEWITTVHINKDITAWQKIVWKMNPSFLLSSSGGGWWKITKLCSTFSFHSLKKFSFYFRCNKIRLTVRLWKSTQKSINFIIYNKAGLVMVLKLFWILNHHESLSHSTALVWYLFPTIKFPIIVSWH